MDRIIYLEVAWESFFHRTHREKDQRHSLRSMQVSVCVGVGVGGQSRALCACMCPHVYTPVVCVHTCERCEWTGRCVPIMNVSILQAIQAMAQAEQGSGKVSSYGPAEQTGCSRHVSSKHWAGLAVSRPYVLGHSTAILLYCKGLIRYIHRNGAPRVASTSWHPEPSHAGISSRQHPFISGVPRERTLCSVTKTYVISYCKL